METLADDGVESPIEAINRQELMAKIRASLQPIEWAVLELHYLEGMSGREVAQKLSLSASRICQIHGRVLSRLKSRLASAAC
jgi:RNA polymerase sigma factor for flagellar operon FliA